MDLLKSKNSSGVVVMWRYEEICEWIDSNRYAQGKIDVRRVRVLAATRSGSIYSINNFIYRD